ncbi:MAG: hypothetical protein JJU35_14925 [Balneolales bacterium]|nr:hypothetical protein [Balneolales bacterium]
MSYSFRIHIKLPKDKGFKFDSLYYQMEGFDNIKPIEIRNAKEGEKISGATELVFISHGYSSNKE